MLIKISNQTNIFILMNQYFEKYANKNLLAFSINLTTENDKKKLSFPNGLFSNINLYFSFGYFSTNNYIFHKNPFIIYISSYFLNKFIITKIETYLFR
jgi:hypothetical protein